MADKTKCQRLAATILRYTTLLLITLRACDVINWPWYIVLSPVIALFAVAAVCVILVGIAEIACKT